MAEAPPALPQGKPTAPSRPATGTDTVTVACKISNGLILQLHEFQDVDEPTFGGGSKPARRAFPVGEPIVVRGSALDLTELRGGRMPSYTHVGGYALTPGVPREFWERWVEQHADDPAVRNHLIFAHASLNEASDAAREREGVVSGYEGIDPADPSKKTGIRAVTTADRPARAGFSV